MIKCLKVSKKSVYKQIEEYYYIKIENRDMPNLILILKHPLVLYKDTLVKIRFYRNTPIEVHICVDNGIYTKIHMPYLEEIVRLTTIVKDLVT